VLGRLPEVVRECHGEGSEMEGPLGGR
jgi:hypothetical protein